MTTENLKPCPSARELAEAVYAAITFDPQHIAPARIEKAILEYHANRRTDTAHELRDALELLIKRTRRMMKDGVLWETMDTRRRQTREALKIALEALARPEPVAEEKRLWCAMCGKMTDHQSGKCPALHPEIKRVKHHCELREEAKERAQLGDARYEAKKDAARLKYIVTRADGQERPYAKYFVLRLDAGSKPHHRKAARDAVLLYAHTVADPEASKAAYQALDETSL